MRTTHTHTHTQTRTHTRARNIIYGDTILICMYYVGCSRKDVFLRGAIQLITKILMVIRWHLEAAVQLFAFFDILNHSGY